MKALFAIIAALALILLTLSAVARTADPVEKAGAVVKVQMDGGHGSGVHIGNGYVLSAAHVVKDLQTVTLKSDLGDIQEAEILWTNKTYDVALLRAKRPGRLGAAHLSCREPKTGELIRLQGSPLSNEFLTTRGFVAGKVREHEHWKAVVPTDVMIGWGMSGGPALDARGNVVGLGVGIMLRGMGMSVVALGIAYVVPGDVICGLMGRA